MIEFTDPLGLEEPTRPIPRKILGMMSAFAAVAVLLTFFSVSTGVGRVPATAADDAAAERLEITFAEGEQGVLEVLSAREHVVLVRMAADEGGFMRGVLRPLRRERVRFAVPVDAPYVLTRHASGAVTLADASTDLVVDIGAFGATSVRHFDAVFTAAAHLP